MRLFAGNEQHLYLLQRDGKPVFKINGNIYCLAFLQIIK